MLLQGKSTTGSRKQITGSLLDEVLDGVLDAVLDAVLDPVYWILCEVLDPIRIV